jgi:hypothetical protein
MIETIVPITRSIDDHIDDWDTASDFVMKSLSKPRGHWAV